MVVPKGLKLQMDTRGGAPPATEEAGPEGTRVLRFLVGQSPQLFPERSAVAAVEWIPSVRLSAGVTVEGWARFLSDQIYGIDRTSPALRKVAQEIAAPVKDRAELPRAVAKWVNEHIEPEADLLEPATFSLARGRGNRTALMLALGRTLGLEVDVNFARALNTAAPDAPLVPQEIDDFGEVLVRFATSDGPRFVDPRLRRAPFGYVGPALAGAPAAGAQRCGGSRPSACAAPPPTPGPCASGPGWAPRARPAPPWWRRCRAGRPWSGQSWSTALATTRPSCARTSSSAR